jgi:ubiquinone/menaquinone biosynthesis C-methylase UbiE
VIYIKAVRRLAARLLDRLYRHPFEGRSARRYARRERPAFEDFDHRLVDALASRLATARRVVDVGAGPGTVGRAIAARFPGVVVIAIEPGDFPPTPTTIRARAEALPLADGVADLAICVSSIRHVADRPRAFAELRRVVRPDGALVIAELDPDASAARIAHHASRLDGAALRLAFGPLVVRTAPSRHTIADEARAAGWRVLDIQLDALQPVYVLTLA